jgi:hypothetical protein
MSLDAPEHLHLVLFIRDAFDLAEAADPPTAVAPGRLPGVPDLRLADGSAPTAADWTRWWLTVLEADRGAVAARLRAATPVDELRRAALFRHGLADGPDFVSLADVPDLQRVARLAFSDFHAWWGRSLELPGPRVMPGAKERLAGVLNAHPLLATHTVAQIEAELGRRAATFDFAVDLLLTAGPDVLTVSSVLVADATRFEAWLDETLRPLI